VTNREFRGSKQRSPDFVLVAYFLARCGRKQPPPQLAVTHWADAYRAFYAALSDGRTEVAFRNSMKNARDEFDSHLRGERVGWQEGAKRKARALSPVAATVLETWEKKSDDDLWLAVHEHIRPRPK
jgi:hypothetical protein